MLRISRLDEREPMKHVHELMPGVLVYLNRSGISSVDQLKGEVSCFERACIACLVDEHAGKQRAPEFGTLMRRATNGNARARTSTYADQRHKILGAMGQSRNLSGQCLRGERRTAALGSREFPVNTDTC
jgi:hypothetical protein